MNFTIISEWFYENYKVVDTDKFSDKHLALGFN